MMQATTDRYSAMLALASAGAWTETARRFLAPGPSLGLGPIVSDSFSLEPTLRAFFNTFGLRWEVYSWGRAPSAALEDWYYHLIFVFLPILHKIMIQEFWLCCSAIGIDSGVVPTPIGPNTKPEVTPPPPGTHLLYSQSGKIEHIPLKGYRMMKQEAKAILHLPVSVPECDPVKCCVLAII